MDFFASIPLLLGILYIKVYFSPSLRHFYLLFLQESVCSGPFLLSWDLDQHVRALVLWSLPPLLRSWPACESSSRGAQVSFHQSGFFLSFSLVSVWISFQIYPSLSSIFHSVVFTSDVVILWFRICFVPFPKLLFSPLSPVCSSCLSCFSYKLLSVFTMVAKIKLPFASSVSGPCKPLCWFSSLVCKPHVTFCIIWLFMMC